MEGYYSSDEDVSWGVYTMREAKRDILRGVAKKIKRRHSFSGRILSNRAHKTEPAKKESLDNQNGTMDTVEDCREAENELDNVACGFAPRLDSSQVTENEPDNVACGFSSRLDSYEVTSTYTNPRNSDCLTTNKNHDQSMQTFIENANAQTRESNILGNIQQTLVDNTIIISSDEDDETNYQIHMIKKLICETDVQTKSLSYWSSLLENEPVDIDAEMEKTSRLIARYNESKMSELSEYHRDTKPIDTTAGMGSNNEEDIIQTVDSSIETDILPSSQSTVSNRSFDDINVNFEDNSAEQFVSPKSVVVSNGGESAVFNDTVEEIEMMFKYGLDYKMPVEEDEKCARSLQNINNLSCSSENHDNEKENSHSSPKSYNSDKISNIPKPKGKTPGERVENRDKKKVNVSISPVSSNLKRKSLENKFKIPFKRLKPVAAQKSPAVQNKLKYKNIVSPVGIYIKNSPGILRQNVVLKEQPSDKCEKTFAARNMPSIQTEGSSENRVLKNIANTDFPEVIYKPAKVNIFKEEEEKIILPKSIQKFVREPIITKHEGRIAGKKDTLQLHEKLMKEELTCTSLNESTLNETDISIVVNKQGFIK